MLVSLNLALLLSAVVQLDEVACCFGTTVSVVEEIELLKVIGSTQMGVLEAAIAWGKRWPPAFPGDLDLPYKE